MVDSIIFDLDGTLWDSTKSVLIAWNKTLKSFDKIKEDISLEQMESAMGLVVEEIANLFYPDLDHDYRMNVIHRCCQEECKHLLDHGGRLYEGLEDVLETLVKSYKLFIVSNCQDGYIEAFLSYHKLDKYFIDYECIGRTGQVKGENIKSVIKRNKLENPIYIGDTISDMKASKLADIPYVYASYGFGNVEDYAFRIDTIKEILPLMSRLNL